MKKENKAIKNRVTGDIENVFRLKEENKTIKDRRIRDIKNLFQHQEEESYYESVRVCNFLGNKYFEYEVNGDRNKILSVEEYLKIHHKKSENI